MPIDKVSNNIISLQSYKNLHPTQQGNEEKPTIPLFKKEEKKGEIVPLEFISVYNGNIAVNSKIKDIKAFLKEYSMNASNKEIKKALENYYNDFPELKKAITTGENFFNDFIETVQKVDFKGLEKIESIYGFGISNSIERKFCEIQGIDPAEIVTNESFSIISDFIKTYALILSEKTDYDVFVFENSDEESEQIQIKKDDVSLLLNPMIFYNIVLFKKPFGDNKVIIHQEDGGSYLYTTKDETAYKMDKNGHSIGALSKKDIDAKGNPKHFLDQSLASGITFYLMAELYKMEDFDESQIIEDEILEDYDIGIEKPSYNAGLTAMLDLIRKDSVARSYFEDGFDPEFLFSCIRDGKFSAEVFEAKNRLYEIVEEAIEEEFDEEVLNQMFYLIEKEDNSFDNNAIDTIANIYIKHFQSKENYEPLIYEIATFIKKNPTDNNTRSLISMAQSEKVNREDLEKLFDILQIFNSTDPINGKIALDEFIEKYQIIHQDIDFDPYKLFFSLFQGYLGK